MDYSYLFEPYDTLVSKADQAFERMAGEFETCVTCEPGCSDCCHAVFGLFLIEAVFLKRDFDQLSTEEKNGAFQRCDAADQELEILQKTLEEFKDDPQMASYSMARARIRCPLLSDDHRCILYPYRPITCRVYGIPTLIRGAPRACKTSKFNRDLTYPTFNLDGIQQELFQLTKELLECVGQKDEERAGLLLSVSKVLQTPEAELLRTPSKDAPE